MNKNEQLEKFVQKVEPKIEMGLTQRTDLLPEEMAAGGEIETLTISKLFKNRLILTSGADGQLVIKDQQTDEKKWNGDKLRMIILHGHHVYKLKEFMKSRPDAKSDSLTDEEKKLLAITYDLPKVSVGNFELTGNKQYLTNPKLFDIVKRSGRINFYCLLPDNPEIDGVVFASFSASGASRYDGLLKASKMLPYPVLPYYIVELSHEQAESKDKQKYRKPVFKFVTDPAYVTETNKAGYMQVADIATMRAKILPLSKQIQDLHKMAIAQTEQGIASDYEEEKEINDPNDPNIYDGQGNIII